jgi:hypothetical protein
MRRRETASAGVSTPSCVSVSTLFGLIASMSWSTWPYHRKKAPMSGPSAPPQRFWIVSNNQSRGFQHQAGRWVIRPPQQQQAPNRFPAPTPRNNQPQQQQQFCQGNGNKCFTCGNVGHYAKNCPRNQQRQMPAPNQDRGRKQKVRVRQGKLNFTTLEELPEGAPVMTGIFSVLINLH